MYYLNKVTSPFKNTGLFVAGQNPSTEYTYTPTGAFFPLKLPSQPIEMSNVLNT